MADVEMLGEGAYDMPMKDMRLNLGRVKSQQFSKQQEVSQI